MTRWIWWLSFVHRALGFEWLGWVTQFVSLHFPHEEVSLTNLHVISSSVLSYQTYLLSSTSPISMSRSEMYLTPSNYRELANALRLMPSTQIVAWSGNEEAQLDSSLHKFLSQLLTVKAPQFVLFACSESSSSKWTKLFFEMGFDVSIEDTLIGRRSFLDDRNLWIFQPTNFDRKQRENSFVIPTALDDKGQHEYREIVRYLIRPVSVHAAQCETLASDKLEERESLQQDRRSLQQQREQQVPQQHKQHQQSTHSSNLGFDESPPIEFLSSSLTAESQLPPQNNQQSEELYIRPNVLAQLLGKEDFKALETALLFNLQQVHSLTTQQRTEMFASFLSLLSNPSFEISKEMGPQFLEFHPLIAQLILVSEFDIDGLFRSSPKLSLWNFLTLFSPVCISWVEMPFLFSQNKYAFASWFQNVFRHLKYGMLVYPTGYLFFERLLAETDQMVESFVSLPFNNLNSPADIHLLNQIFFGVTYIPRLSGKVDDVHIKKHINNYLQHVYPAIVQWPSPSLSSFSFKPVGSLLRIGVVSGSWLAGHSVYRNFAQATYALSQDANMELTLIFLGEESLSQRIMTDHFCRPVSGETACLPRVKYIGWESHAQLIAAANWITSQEFDVLFYPDLGMTPQSLLLGNKRLAKGLQVASYGHSSSTQGALIDYWIGGSEVELIENGTTGYSETLVLLPGLGITHNQLSQFPSKSADLTFPKTFIVTLSWSLSKLNYPHLLRIKRILELVHQHNEQQSLPRHYLVRLLLINVDHAKDTLVAELQRQFAPFEVEVQTSLISKSYLQTFQEGHLFLGSHPYGDCNTVLDALTVGVPLVLWEGREWRNRIGPAMLRRARLSVLVASTEEEYIKKAILMLTNHEIWSEVTARVRSLDMKTLFYESQDLMLYPDLFRYLYHNHSLLSSYDSRVFTFS